MRPPIAPPALTPGRPAAWLGVVALCGLGIGCTSGETLDAGPVDGGAPPLALDATVVDSGPRYDGGVVAVEDAGFRDPATLFDSLTYVADVRTYIRIRGTLTSTMPPVMILNTGPMLGHEYLVEPLDFLLGPGGAEDPDRLLIFYDMRATGRSGFGSIASSTITIDAHVEDLGHMLDWVEEETGRAGPYDVVAHGYGAAVATLFTVERPGAFNRMVFVAPYPADILEQADWGATVNRRLNRGERERLAEISEWNYCLRDLPRCSRDAWNIVGPTWFCDEHRMVFETMTFRHIDARAFLFFISHDLREREFDFRPQMAQVPHPVTIITGPCDAIPERTGQSWADALPQASLHVIDGAGHFPMTEAAPAFRRIVRRALTY